jgi:hypothetical protein
VRFLGGMGAVTFRRWALWVGSGQVFLAAMEEATS